MIADTLIQSDRERRTIANIAIGILAGWLAEANDDDYRYEAAQGYIRKAEEKAREKAKQYREE